MNAGLEMVHFAAAAMVGAFTMTLVILLGLVVVYLLDKALDK